MKIIEASNLIRDPLKRNLSKLTPNIEWPGEYNSKLQGEKYHESGKVKIKYINSEITVASIRGVSLYTTTLEWTPSSLGETELVSSCSCPAYKNYHEPCKHIWAIMRSVEDSNSSNDTFLEALSDHELENDIYIMTHSESDSFGHLSLSSYQNRLLKAIKTPSVQEIKTSEVWRKDLATLQRYIADANEEVNESKENFKTSQVNIWYELEPYSGIQIYSNFNFINITFYETSKLKDGRFGKLKKRSFNDLTINQSKYAKDAKYLNLLKGHLVYDYGKHASEASIPSSLGKLALKELLASRRLFTYSSDNETGSDITPLSMGHGVFSFSANISKDNENWILGGIFKNQSIELDSQEILLSTDLSFLVYDHMIYPTDLGKLRTHCEYLIGLGDIVIPLDKKDDLKKIIKNTLGLEQTLLDQDFGIEKKVLKGNPKIELVIDERKETKILAQLTFLYDGESHTPLSKKDIFNDSGINDLFYLKDKKFEKHIIQFLEDSKEVFSIEHLDTFTFNIDPKELNLFVSRANNLSIEIRTQGYQVKHYHSTKNRIKSNNDWFELDGHIHFDKDDKISIPDIIKKKSLDNNFILLGDGTIGIKPTVWLNKMNKLAELGVKVENRFKFNRAQSIILDLLLEETEVTRDNKFISTVNSLKSFKGVEKTSISKRFNGELRHYQKSGIDWLNFLHQFQIGGCLADDMGLGKTIQVLAQLQKIKYTKDEYCKGQHLIVVPKSLVYNWQAEAQKFTPDLKVLIYEGTSRKSLIKKFANFDLIIMTYAVMRKDIQELKDFQFSYSVLDEAQYIKNTTTLVAKAAYLINSKYKLALTGTPVENHIGELFSIFRYLIPSILPKGYSSGKIKSNEESMKIILRGLMPFILRRSKSEVLPELPEKVESVLYCEFEKKQAEVYLEMKNFYQKSLTQKINEESINKSKIQILEALLRMRQVACHPGLVNKDYLLNDSSKIITLMENVESLIERGEKVLVFSQFTSFLSIIKNEFDKRKIGYAYLDGKTTKREQVVNSFKEDESKKVFLISLKAGGVGLNLTQASYCFLIDPWWNPAVESQAIDRIHRIGQSKKVFAYRLITKGSIEEKILKLQQNKRAVSDNILATDESLLKQMSTEDLQFLFS
jgi:SNF2 family DNA or RNA helicase